MKNVVAKSAHLLSLDTSLISTERTLWLCVLFSYSDAGKQLIFNSLIDEGSGMINTWGQQFATPAVAEKGHYDLGITVSTLGGHSSVPPPHTAIGLISLLIAELERNPHEATIAESSPVYEFMTCAAAYAKDMPKKLKGMVIKAEDGDLKAWKSLPEEIISVGMGGAPAGPGQGDPIKSMLTTTQAVDIIHGGLKVNALVSIALSSPNIYPRLLNLC